MKRRLKLLEGSKVGGANPPTGSEEPSDLPGNDGFTLKFSGGRGVLSLQDLSAAPAVRLDLMEMSIPRIAFPFDVSMGVRGLRDRRHHLELLQLTVKLGELSELVAARLARVDWVANPRMTFEEDCLSVLLDFGPKGSRIPFGFRLLPSVGDRHPSLMVDEMRAYGPMPMPLLVVALTVLREVTGSRLEGIEFRPPDPVKEVLRRLLPSRGWRIPDYSKVALDRFELLPDRAVLEFRSLDQVDEEVKTGGEMGMERMRRMEELRMARAGDRNLALGELDEARAAYSVMLDREPESGVAAARLAMMDVADTQRRDTARALLAESEARKPGRSDVLAVAAHGAALDEDAEAETAALEKLLESSLPLERLAAGRRLGDLFRDRDPARAITYLETALGARREDPETLFSLIEIGAESGRKEMVERLVPRWIAVHKGPASRSGAHMAVGAFFLDKLGEPGIAVKHFERASLADPADMEAAWGLARALAGSGDHRRAISRFERIEKRCIESEDREGAARAMEAIGGIWMERGEPDLAAPRFKEAIEAGAEGPGLHVRLSEALGAMGHHAEAASALENALNKVDPGDESFDWVSHALELARMYMEDMGDPDAARPWIRAASKHEDGEARALSLKADLLERQGDWKGLTRVLERTLASDPSVERVLALAQARIKAGDHRAALSTLEGVLEDHPERVDLMDAYIEASRGAEDRSRLRRALKDRYETCADPGRRGAIASEIGGLELKFFENPQAAIDWFRRAIEHDTQLLEARAGLIDCLERLGETEELEANLEVVAEGLRREDRRRESATVMARRAGLLADRGRMREAADLWREALPDLPDAERHEALRNLASLYLEADDPAAARDLFAAARKEPGAREIHTAAIGEAEASLRLGDYENALEAATAAGSGPVELRSRSARAASRALVHMGRSREAARLLERVAQNVEDAEATELLMIGAQIFRHEVKDLSRARDLFERLLEIDPSHEQGRSALVDLLEASGDRAELARGLVRFAGDDESGMADLKRAADFFSAEELHDEAANALRTALEISPDSETARMLAGALRRCGETDEMLEVLKEHSRGDEGLKEFLADQLEDLGRFEDLAYLLKSMEGSPGDRELDRLLRLASIRSTHLGEKGAAVRDLLAASRICDPGPRRREISNRAVILARELGNPDLVAAAMENNASQLEGKERASVLLELAGVHFSRQDHGAAMEALQRTLEGGDLPFDSLVRAGRENPSFTELCEAAAREAARLREWNVSEEMLSLTIESAPPENRVQLLRKRAAIRRGRLEDREGALQDLLDVRGAGGLAPPELEELLDMLQNRGDLEEAARVALELAESTGWDGPRVARAARLFQEVGDRDRARDLWRRAVDANPDPSSTIALVSLLDPTADGEEMSALLESLRGKEELLDIPEHLALLEAGVDLDLARGQELEAVEGLAAMMDLDPGRRDPWQKMVNILERRGEWEALTKRMAQRQEQAEAPDDVARTAMALGRILEEKLGDEDGAVRAFERVVEVLPEHQGANAALARIAYNRRNWAQLEEYLGALEGAEWTEEAATWRARTAEHFGRVDDALAIYRDMVARGGPSPVPVEGICRLGSDPTCDREVVELARGLVDRMGQDGVKSAVHRRLGLALMRIGDAEQARSVLEHADRLSGGDPETQELLARIHGEAGRHREQAELLCRLAFSYEGKRRGEVLLEAAKIYLDALDDIKRANHWLERAVDASPDNPEILLIQADTAWELGDKAVVAKNLERHRLVSPGVPLGASRTYHFAAALAHTKEWPAADIAELLEGVFPYIDGDERAQAEELLASLKEKG